MNKIIFNPIIRIAIVATSFTICACATTKHTAAPSPAKSASGAVSTAAPSPAAAPTATPVSMPTGALTRVGGVVLSEDPAAHTLTIKDYSGNTHSFTIAGGARLTKGGTNSAVQLSDLSAGDRVQLKVRDNVAASVHVLIKPAS